MSNWGFFTHILCGCKQSAILFCCLEQWWFLPPLLLESASVFLKQPVSLGLWWQMLIIMYISLHVNFCFIHVKLCPVWFLITPARHRTASGRASAYIFIYRRWPVPVGYVTTQEKNNKNRMMPGRLSNSPVIWKSLQS